MRDMADNKLIGQNYTTPDLVAKVTGKAKYAEDYRVDGMLFAKLLVSPYPHARVKRLDTSAAMAYPGVKAILTADDMPGAAAGATLGEGAQARRRPLKADAAGRPKAPRRARARDAPAAARAQRRRRRRRSSSGNGPTRTSRKQARARCRSARPATSGRSATSTAR